MGYPLPYSWASLVAQMVKNLPAMQETWVQSLGWEDPLEEGMAAHSSILAWRILWTVELGGPQSMGLQRVATKHSHLLGQSSFSSVSQSCPTLWTPWTAAHQAFLSIISSQSLFKFNSITSVMPSNHFILCCPLLPQPSILPSSGVFSNESVLCIRWPQY